MNKGELFLRKHSSTILTCIGAAGVVVTSVLSVKATPKALCLIEEAKEEKGGCDLTPIEIVKVAWKPYIPAIISGVSTITCIFGANYLNHRTQASLMSAYALLDNTYKEYRKKVKEKCPEEAPIFEHEIIKSKFDKNMELDDDKELFFDYQSMKYFESTFKQLDLAEEIINKKLSNDGFACLNDLYDILGIDHVPYGYQLGWSSFNSDKLYGHSELKFEYEKVEIDDGLECNILTIDYPASIEYIC